MSCTLYSQDIDSLYDKVWKYYESENYTKAISTALLFDSIMNDENDLSNPDCSEFMNVIGSCYDNLGQYDSAAVYYKNSIENFRNFNDTINDPNFVSVLNSYANLLVNIKHFSEAEPLLAEALYIQKTNKGENSREYASCLSTLGSLQEGLGNTKEAESDYINAINIWKKKPKSDYRDDYISTLSSLASLYFDKDQFKLSLPLVLEVAKNNKKTYGETSSQYAESLNDMGYEYLGLYDLNAALSYYKKALEVIRVACGEKSEQYANCLNDIATVNIEMGNYSQGELLDKQAIDILREGGFNYEEVLSDLAYLYLKTGDFSADEKLCLELLIMDGKKGKESEDYVYDQNLLANLYTNIGSYDKALPLYKSIIENSKKTAGEKSTAYAVDLDNLGHLYVSMGKEELAQPLVLKAIEIKKAAYGAESPFVAYSLRTLGKIYWHQKKFADAEICFKQAGDIYLKKLGMETDEYAGSLFDLANLYHEEGKNTEAEQCFDKDIAIVEKQFGDNSQDYTISVIGLAETYESLGKSDVAESLYLKANSNFSTLINQNFSFMDEKEKENYITDISSYFEVINSFVFRRKTNNPSITGLSYNNELELKGIVLQSSRALRQAALNSNDQALINLYDSFYKNKQLLSKLNLKPVAERWLSTDSLENICSGEEKDLNSKIRQTPGFEGFLDIGSQINWQDIEKALGNQEAAIEFISFKYNNEKNAADSSIMYCALLLRHGYNHPEMIYLFKEDELKALINESKSGTDELTADKLYKLPLKDKSTSMNKLYSLVWEPLDTLLAGVKTIYYSPAGLLNKISFDAIPVNDSVYLSDKYNMHEVLSTRVILKKDDEVLQKNTNVKPVVYGGINYDTDTTTMKSAATRYLSTDSGSRSHFISGDVNRRGGFNYLEGTLREAEEIGKILNKNKVNQVVLTGSEATEESFKSLNNMNSPVFIHIATHGFFFPAPSKTTSVQVSNKKSSFDVFRNSDNPLLRSGLIFAGGNNAWKNKALPAGVEDGILLASEVAEMYLPNTKLVVLSACETGLGDIQGSEGVFGLQRAFKMAGVKYLINSLWQVPDYQTSELMSKFYENWLSGLTIHDSFRNAQFSLKKEYPDDPFDWAAFVLVE